MKLHILLFSIFLCLPLLMQAQDSPTEEVDLELESTIPFMKNSQFGIMLELNNSLAEVNIANKSNENYPQDVNSVSAESGLGIGLGIMYGQQINNNLTIRSQAFLSFIETNYIFDIQENNNRTLKRETVNVELPVHIVLENVDKKVSPSVILGARYRHNFANNTTTSKLVGNFSTSDILVDTGVGVGFQIDNFRFKTELLYSRGLINQIGENPAPSINNAIESIHTNQFSLRFMFYM